MSDSRTADSSGTVHRSRLPLAVGLLFVVVALAGCAGPGSITLTAADDARLAEANSQSVDPDAERGRIVSEAVETGAANDTAIGGRAVEPGDVPYRYDGAYYSLSRTVVDEQEAYAAQIEVDYDPTNVTGADAVRFSALSPADRRALGALFPPVSDRRNEGYDTGTLGVYTPAELADSALAVRDETTERVVVVDGERYRVRVAEVRQTTRKTYRYTAEERFAGDEAYADHLRAEHQFRLSSVPAEEREVLRQAADGGYTADGEDDTAFQSVVDRFRGRDAIRSTEFDGEWLVRWQGQTYLVDIRFGEYTGN